MVKQKQQKISNEGIRQKILEFLHSIRKKARGLKSIAVGVADIKKGLKPLGITQNEVVINLDFLVQHKWVIEIVEKRIFKSKKGFEFPSEKLTYKLSDLGINYFEGSSRFSTMSRFAGINISNVQGIVVLGDNNIVRQEHINMFKKLEQLENAMKINSGLSEDQKLTAQVDIQTIKDQLAKPYPDKSIIQRAVDTISFLGSIPGVAELFKIVKTTIENLLK